MQLRIFSALLFVIFASCSTAQFQRCNNRQWTASCSGSVFRGHGGPGCRAVRLWVFDPNSRQCRPLAYRGCGGNSNRWCTRDNCRRACARSG